MSVQPEATHQANPSEALVNQAQEQGVTYTAGFAAALEDLKTPLGIESLEIESTEGRVHISGGTEKVGMGITTWQAENATSLQLGPTKGVAEPVVSGLSLAVVKDFAAAVESSEANLPSQIFLQPVASKNPEEGAEKPKPVMANLTDINTIEDLGKINAQAGSDVVVAYADPYSNRSFNLWLKADEPATMDPSAEPTFSLRYLKAGAPTHGGLESSMQAVAQLVAAVPTEVTQTNTQ